jgi:glycosyltransferase involved in cell wall biosynthesis
LNEEANLPGALESLRGRCDDIWVLDSGSTDLTTSIARKAGAHVVTRKFDDYASQRNAGLSQQFRNEWILMLDADERVSEDLWAEMSAAIASVSPTVTMFRMRRKDYFLGKWLRRSSGYPTWFGRLIRHGKVEVRRPINEEYVTTGEVKYLRGHLFHFPFNRGISHWVTKHNSYSSLEAQRLLVEVSEPLDLAGLTSRDPVRRRRSMKRLAFRLPCRSVITFVYLYVIRLGFLDGMAGLTFCRLRATYEFLIDVKLRELTTPKG